MKRFKGKAILWLCFTLVLFEMGLQLEAYLLNNKKKGAHESEEVMILGNCFSTQISKQLQRKIKTSLISENHFGASPEDLVKIGGRIVQERNPGLVLSMIGFDLLDTPFRKKFFSEMRHQKSFLRTIDFFKSLSFNLHKENDQEILSLDEMVKKFVEFLHNNEEKNLNSHLKIILKEPFNTIEPLYWSLAIQIRNSSEIKSEKKKLVLKSLEDKFTLEIKNRIDAIERNTINKKDLEPNEIMKALQYYSFYHFLRAGELNPSSYSDQVQIYNYHSFLLKYLKHINDKSNTFADMRALEEYLEKSFIKFNSISEKIFKIIKNMNMPLNIEESWIQLSDNEQKYIEKNIFAVTISYINNFSPGIDKALDVSKVLSNIWSRGLLESYVHAHIDTFLALEKKLNTKCLLCIGYKKPESQKGLIQLPFELESRILAAHKELARIVHESGGQYVIIQFPGISDSFLRKAFSNLENITMINLTYALDDFHSKRNQYLYSEIGPFSVGHLSSLGASKSVSYILKKLKNHRLINN